MPESKVYHGNPEGVPWQPRGSTRSTPSKPEGSLTVVDSATSFAIFLRMGFCLYIQGQ